MKLRHRAKQEQEGVESNKSQQNDQLTNRMSLPITEAPSKAPSFHDCAAWTLHIDKIILATDSLVNLFTLEPQYRRNQEKQIDENLIESVVRRQLVPAIRDLLSYGLIDNSFIPRPSSYISMIFDPYYVLSSLTCFPSSQKMSSGGQTSSTDKIHVWSVIEEYYKTRNEPAFQSSSVKTLSQSFNLELSISGPIKITSKQALLIAVDDIVEILSKCKPNGPESHFKAFVYTALNSHRLATWLRLVFRNKSITKKFYHNYSFVCQSDKMDKFLTTIEALARFDFKLRTDVESTEQYVGAF